MASVLPEHVLSLKQEESDVVTCFEMCTEGSRLERWDSSASVSRLNAALRQRTSDAIVSIEQQEM